MMYSLDGKRAVVTGAARGIGQQLCRSLIIEGAHVIGADVALHELEQFKSAEFPANSAFAVYEADVSNASSVSALFDFARDRFGRVDILINNAGVNNPAPLESISESEWDRVMDINLKGPFLCTKAAVPLMKGGSSGSIVNVVSPAGKTGGARVASAAYNSSKGGLITLTKSAARELAKYGIRVNGVSPGVIGTEMILSMDSTTQADLLNLIPFGRMGEPREVAESVVFLCSDAAAYITGQILPVNGGMWMLY